MTPPDWKPKRRSKDPALMKRLHVRGVVCVLCGEPGSLHHVYPKGQGGDDVAENLIGLCGSGTTGHHGQVTANDTVVRLELGAYLASERPDTVFYVLGKLGEERGREWLRRRLFMSV